MKKIIPIFLLLLCHHYCFAQTGNAKALVDEGVALHDKGDYENALKKYDAAIAEDATYIKGHYEKSYTLYALKKYEECITISKQIIKQFNDDIILKAVYVQCGSALDDWGKQEEAIKMYSQGLKKYPDYYLLHFNKGITHLVMKDGEKAYDAFKDGLKANPLHASGYYRVAALLKSTNHIPAMMAGIMHLIIEPDSKRAVETFNDLKTLLYANVKKTGEKSVTITMDVSMFDTKKTKKEPDNFRMQEMLFTMSSALDKDSVMNTITKTEIEKFDLKLQLLINSLNNNEKGFFSERYVPFFKKIKENNFTMIVSRLVFSNTGDERNDAWLKTNTDKVDEFYNWLKEYQWPVK